MNVPLAGYFGSQIKYERQGLIHHENSKVKTGKKFEVSRLSLSVASSSGLISKITALYINSSLYNDRILKHIIIYLEHACLRRLRSERLNPKFGSQKSALL